MMLYVYLVEEKCILLTILSMNIKTLKICIYNFILNPIAIDTSNDVSSEKNSESDSQQESDGEFSLFEDTDVSLKCIYCSMYNYICF